MAYVIRGLDPAPFMPLYGLSNADLAQHRAVRRRADADYGFPCRVTLEDAAPGEDLLLVNYTHLPADNPFHASHAVFVREGVREPAEYSDAVPVQLSSRLMSLRALDSDNMLVRGEVMPGEALADAIEPWLADPAVAYLHAHNAKLGCFFARIDRA